jgi:hypothetical protein
MARGVNKRNIRGDSMWAISIEADGHIFVSFRYCATVASINKS